MVLGWHTSVAQRFGNQQGKCKAQSYHGETRPTVGEADDDECGEFRGIICGSVSPPEAIK